MSDHGILNIIKSRRSVRSFTAEPVSAEDVQSLVDAALWAPSGKGEQSWQFTVVENPASIARLAESVAHELDTDPNKYNFYKPALLIITSNERTNTNGANDCACAMQNMMLEAHALGLGSVWINQAIRLCDEPALRAVFRTLGVPDSHQVYGMLAVGHPQNGYPEPKARRGKVVYADR